MASNSFTGSTNNSYITPKISWTSTPDTNTNTSSVTVTLQLCKSSSSTASTYGTGTWTLNINGTAYTFTTKVTIPADNTYRTICSQTVTGISHNPDGTKSITISATGGISGTSYTTTTISGTATFDTIARASALSVASSTNTGSSLTATITPANTSFRHKIQYIIDGVAKYTSDYIAKGTTTFAYTIPHSWLPTSTSKSMTVRLYTYVDGGTTSIGQVDKTITVNVPSTIKPSISSFTAAIGSGGLSGLYVQGKSTVKLTCSATMGDSATVTSYTFSGANINTSSTSNTATSAIITSSGTLTYKVKVTDSRGRYAEATVGITVYPYTTPKIVSISAQRCNSSGVLDKDGTCAKITVTTSHSAISTANSAKVVIDSSKDNYAADTTVITSTNASNTYTGVYGSGFATSTAYTIRATITDVYGATHNLSATLESAKRPINFAKYGNGIALGGMSSVTSASATGLFECKWNAKFSGSVNPATTNTSSLGTTDYKFKEIHGVNLYENGTLLSNKYKQKGTYVTLLGYTTLAGNTSATFTSTETFSAWIVYTYTNDAYYESTVTAPLLGSVLSVATAATVWPFILSKNGNTYTLTRNGTASLSYIVVGVQ